MLDMFSLTVAKKIFFEIFYVIIQFLPVHIKNCFCLQTRHHFHMMAMIMYSKMIINAGYDYHVDSFDVIMYLF